MVIAVFVIERWMAEQLKIKFRGWSCLLKKVSEDFPLLKRNIDYWGHMLGEGSYFYSALGKRN